MPSLGHVVSGLDGYEDLTDAASGSGTELIRLLRNAASPEDRAAVSATHTEIVRNGVTGETTSDTFKVFYDKYKKATRHLPPGALESGPVIGARCVPRPGGALLYSGLL